MRLLCGLLLATVGALAIQPARRDLGRPMAGAAANSALNTVRNRPYEWGRGAAGAVKRFGSSLGQHAAKEGIQFGVNTWLHENLRYVRSNKHGTWPRMAYALKHTFVVPRKNRRGGTFAVSRVSGNMGAGMISRVWQPASAAGAGAGLASGGIGIGADVGMNVAREFWPRKKHSKR